MNTLAKAQLKEVTEAMNDALESDIGTIPYARFLIDLKANFEVAGLNSGTLADVLALSDFHVLEYDGKDPVWQNFLTVYSHTVFATIAWGASVGLPREAVLKMVAMKLMA